MIQPNLDMYSVGPVSHDSFLMHPATEMAIIWLVRSLDESRWTEEDAAALQAWLEESSIHQGEFDAAQATLTLMSRKELLSSWMAEGS
ncbi:DUF4880 domain-containing protein [Verrucomicrobium sp. BvORR034]|uniref:DUF4880 domain-containing protein n=1 Tax=Verrucomicrobium sp. BvORR034 TaxID=1396418 RepID=UPI0006798F8C|nr:DUF4880 domain-containing protein [Verrucomicrobium sp. BvORR034]